MKSLTIVFILLSLLFPAGSAFAKVDTSSIKFIPMQSGGRLKPYDTFAKESLQLIYGKRKFNKRPAHEVVLTWFLLPEIWAQKEMVEIKKNQLKETLKLPLDKNFFAAQALLSNDRTSLVFQELATKQKNQEKLDPYFQSVQRLQSQLGLFRGIANGVVLGFVPPKEGTTWKTVVDKELPPHVQEKFRALTGAFIRAVSLEVKEGATSEEFARAQADFDSAVTGFMASAKAENPALYGTETEMFWEVHYNSLDPFMWSWIIYILGTLLLAFAWYTGGNKLYVASWATLVVGFLMHTYGFGLRIYIADRPPVSNMYETVIWVSWGGMIFGMIIEALYKQRFILLCGTIGAALCLMLASFAPTVLDPSISPLEPVLVSNFWLLVHVLTITISYSAFLLAFVLGDVGLAFALKDEKKHRVKIQNMANAIYRSIQIGVVLLAAGIILGGIWADYSWGRFWGWDPKETWALIALLGYVAILHGRLAGWLGPFGMNATAVVAFSLIIMAWYGVNFVLGAGLHAYGFGGGGVQYVSAFVGIHFVYVAYAVMARQKATKPSKTSVAPLESASLEKSQS